MDGLWLDDGQPDMPTRTAHVDAGQKSACRKSHQIGNEKRPRGELTVEDAGTSRALIPCRLVVTYPM